MKQQKLQISYLLLAALLGTSCSNENDPITPIDKTDAIELGITAGVSLTKSAVTAWTNGDNIAVFATGTDYTAIKKNDHAIYTYDGSSWDNSVSDKIYLTHEVATIYAYYPSTLIKPTDTDKPVVAISVFEGDDTSDDSKYPALASLDASTLITAPGEVDYMWAEDADAPGSLAQASNGKKNTNVDDAVKLNMKHGLAMVSFNIYNDKTYKGAGKLTKIVLKNGSDSGLSKGTSTMALENGTIAVSSPAAATYTRGFKDADGYAISNDKGTALKFSFLVLPDNSSAVFDKTKVQVVFTIDGADYPVALTAPNSDNGKWLAGNNYLYTAKLSGKELSITSVSIAGWTDKTGGELGVK